MMKNYDAECIDPTLGAEIEMISKTDDIGESVDYWYERTPYLLLAARDHCEECEYCRNTYPGARDRIAQIENSVIERARQEIEKLSAEFAAEFPQTPGGAGRDDTKFNADRMATIVSIYSDPIIGHKACLMPLTDSMGRMVSEEFSVDFNTFLDSYRSSEEHSLPEYRQNLNLLSFEARRFVFTCGLAGDIFFGLRSKFESMCIPCGISHDAAGKLVTVDNPEYPIFQAFLMEAMNSQKYKDKHIGSVPFGETNPLVADFVRMKMLDALLEIPIDYRRLYLVLEHAAVAYLHFSDEHDQGVEANKPTVGTQPLAGLLGGIRTELSDGIDSLRAGQMELRLAIERERRTAKAFLPLIETRLGVVYDRLHRETIELLARGEYFLSINSGEPDAMEPVVMSQAKACENELYMIVFGKYLLQLHREGIMDYLVDRICKSPLLMEGKPVTRNMNLATYCWYLKHDSKLQAWIESTLGLSIDGLIRESYWINGERNAAAHEKNYNSYKLKSFQDRLYSATGLLNCLHPSV
jgi:hypothetical protein